MVKVMVPFFDMLNHNPAAKTQHGFDEKTGCFVFKTQQVSTCSVVLVHFCFLVFTQRFPLFVLVGSALPLASRCF